MDTSEVQRHETHVGNTPTGSTETSGRSRANSDAVFTGNTPLTETRSDTNDQVPQIAVVETEIASGGMNSSRGSRYFIKLVQLSQQQ
ncbi:hypothetical protein FPOAC1_009395 [Fusarium poae]|uniref:hypothetical protein n=1 Tax=Fusarium poae TaxID=36050 RepID=UPI001CE8D53A|nr:hypothetical protein FPOAC1_009395 [Fusarium poae]KAG8669992.1 hypothetical protein FPOAC1_009395 [Fusarium poae]